MVGAEILCAFAKIIYNKVENQRKSSDCFPEACQMTFEDIFGQVFFVRRCPSLIGMHNII